MKILVLDSQNSGCWWYRGKVPVAELRKRGHEVVVSEPVKIFPDFDFDAWDLVVVSRGIGGVIDPLLMAPDHYRRCAIAYETDDALELVSYGNVYYEAIRPMLFNYFRCLERACLVTTTTEALADHLATIGYRDRSATVAYPNSVCLDDWRERPREQRKKLRIGFAGSNTHLHDIVPFLEGYLRVQEERPGETELVIFGFTAGQRLRDWREQIRTQLGNLHFMHPLYQDLNRFVELCEKVDDLSIEPMVHFEAYPERLAQLDLDLGVCPLDDTPFNRLKSAVKLYEYAMVGTPCIASDSGPYHDEMGGFPGSLVHHTAKGWHDAIVRALDDREWLNELGRQQREWVVENRNVEKTCDVLEAAYEAAVERQRTSKS